mgnify:CR=1 FL=1
MNKGSFDVLVRIPLDYKERLDAEAKQRGFGNATFIRMILLEWFQQHLTYSKKYKEDTIKTQHHSVDINDAIEFVAMQGERQDIVKDNHGGCLPLEKALNFLKEKRDSGVREFSSNCPTPRPDGVCPGHAKE